MSAQTAWDFLMPGKGASMFQIIKFRYLFPALIALGTVIYGVVVSTVNTRNNLRDTARVAHSRQVLSSIKDVQRQMLDMETGGRGYVIAGEAAYLTAYEHAAKRVDVEVTRLMDLTRDNPTQQAHIGQFKDAITGVRDAMETAVEARKTRGLEAAAAEMKNGGGRDHMDRLRVLTDEVHRDELILLLKREDKLQRTLGRTNLTVSVTGLVAIAGGILGTTLLFLFLSSKVQAERMRQEKEKAMEADRAKSDFLAMMSHEIRTPMNAILGFSELLHDRATTPQDKHFAGAILSSGNSLLTLINDILDLSKIEAGKIDSQPETVVMERFTGDLETLFSFRTAEKNLDFSVRMDPGVPSFLRFDAARLRQVLVNLVGNAIKFTEEGSVTVTLGADDATTDDVVVLHVEVQDTGIGIAANQLDDIFRPFYQVDSRQDRRFQGTGLGLGISRRLVEVMDGSVSVESTLGKGSLFRVSVPTLLSHRPEPDTVDPATGRPVDFSLLRRSKILVLDDDALGRDLIRNHLGTTHQVYEAEDGNQVLTLSSEIQPDVILMDIRSSAVDERGNTMANIRSMQGTRHIPVIAIIDPSLQTNHAGVVSLFDGHAEKPLSRAGLFVELARFIPTQDPPNLGGGEVAAHGPIPKGRCWPELCEKLDDLHRSVWPELVKLVPAKGSIKFGTLLMELADQHSCPPLADYSRHLMTAAEMMDFPEAGRMLQNYPALIAQLRSSQ